MHNARPQSARINGPPSLSEDHLLRLHTYEAAHLARVLGEMAR